MPFSKSNEKQIDHKVHGYDVDFSYSGQKARYGDTFREYNVKTDKPESEVKAYCIEHVRKCDLTTEQYLKEERAGVKDFGDHFRHNYKFTKISEGHYFYQITEPSTH